MNSTQIDWAKRHDWFLSETDGIVKVAERVMDQGEIVESFRYFADFDQLYTWAGY